MTDPRDPQGLTADGFTGHCPTCGQPYLAGRLAEAERIMRECIVRAAVAYWMRDEVRGFLKAGTDARAPG